MNVPSWSPDSKQVAFVSYEQIRAEWLLPTITSSDKPSRNTPAQQSHIRRG